MDAVNCKLKIPKVEGLEDQLLTVGRRLTFACDGSWDKQFNFSEAQLSIEGFQPAMTRVFQAQAIDINGFEVDATFYVAAKIPVNTLKLKDSLLEIPLNHSELQIQSVLPPPPKNQGQQQEPPKPYGFLLGDMAYPNIYFGLGIGLLVLIAFVFIFSILRRRYWRKLENELRNYDSPVSAEGQAYRQLRILDKDGYSFTELKKIVYLYILRRYQTPIFELKKSKSNRKLNAYLKNKWPRLKNQRRQIFHFVNDIDVLEKSPLQEQVENSKKLIRRFYDFVDDSEDYFQKNQTSRDQQS